MNISFRKLYSDRPMVSDDGRVNYMVDVEDAEIWMRTRNLRGEANKFGSRTMNFDIWLDDCPEVDDMIRDGWGVKEYVPKSDEYEPRKHINIVCSFRDKDGNALRRQPKIIMITNGKQTELNEETCNMFDDVEIVHADLTFRPYNWDVNGKQGVKAYLDTIYFEIEEGGFAAKYAE